MDQVASKIVARMITAMKTVEKKILKAVKFVAKKQSTDPSIPGCVIIYHQPKRPKKSIMRFPWRYGQMW